MENEPIGIPPPHTFRSHINNNFNVHFDGGHLFINLATEWISIFFFSLFFLNQKCRFRKFEQQETMAKLALSCKTRSAETIVSNQSSYRLNHAHFHTFCPHSAPKRHDPTTTCHLFVLSHSSFFFNTYLFNSRFSSEFNYNCYIFRFYVSPLCKFQLINFVCCSSHLFNRRSKANHFSHSLIPL